MTNQAQRSRKDSASPSEIINMKETMENNISMKFPQDLMQTNARHYMRITCFKYEQHRQRSLGQQSVQTGSAGRIYGFIHLPIPLELSTTYGANYDEFKFANTAGRAATAVTNNVNGSVGSIANLDPSGYVNANLQGLSDTGNIVWDAIKDVYQKGREGMLLSETLDNLGGENVAASNEAARGVYFNPRSEVKFGGMNFRTHAFAFSMWARNPKETEEIYNIIRFLKYHMHPSYGSASNDIDARTIQYPSEFVIEFLPGQKYMFSIGDSFLTSFSHTINSQGQAFFKGTDAPVNHIIQMVFRESDIISREDIDSSYNSGKPY